MGLASGLLQSIRRFGDSNRGDLLILGLSAAFFFCVLCAFYILRPLRDDTAIRLGHDFIQYSLTMTFLVMLAAVPTVGWLVNNVKRSRIVPFVYSFFIVTLLLFWVLLRHIPENIWVSGAFIVWTTVFSLFVVSLFWSFMSDIWNTAQAKRLYGLVSVGGSCGALAGPLLTQALVGYTGVANLLLLSALFLASAIGLQRLLHAKAPRTSIDERLEKPIKASLMAGAIHVWRSPYLFRIGLWVLFGELLNIFFYLEQVRILGESSMDQLSRVLGLARIETAVSLLTILLELFVTARLIKLIGISWTLSLSALWAIIALAALLTAPTLITIMIIIAGVRALDNGVTSPTLRILYTVVDPGDKYRSQNFTDTAIVRGGNLASVWLLSGARKGLGLAAPIVTCCALPIALAWAWASLDLGRRYEKIESQMRAD